MANVQIKKPANSGLFYYNYKNIFSIIMQADVNSQLQIYDVGP